MNSTNFIKVSIEKVVIYKNGIRTLLNSIFEESILKFG